jgi:hypothetical protein
MSRSLLPLTAFCMVGLALASQDAPSAGQERAGAKHSAAFNRCAEECGNCQRACESCAAHCANLLAEGKKEHQATLQSCQDCATLCGAAASVLARRGPFADLLCKVCMEACARCAKECEKFNDDAEMKQCALACRRCEQACRNMPTHLHADKTTERRDSK